jgi:RND superfamily putative drug exporter
MAEAERLADRGQAADAQLQRDFADERMVAAEAAWEETLRLDRELAAAHNNLSLMYQTQGNTERAAQHARLARDFSPNLENPGQQLLPADATDLPILDVWTRHTDVVGDKLRSRDRKAELIVVRLSQEFMATDNIRVLQRVESALEEVEQSERFPAALQINLTGSAAVGGDMLRSAAESIKNTELTTVLLVIAILAVVYRSPLLVAVPLVTIIISVAVAMPLVAALTRVNELPGFEWWNFKIFTTTRIFVVVILFGAGTDFCLFLISRYKEELDGGQDRAAAVSLALAGVGEALSASALTTIVGLSTMFFADFGKFRNSGPAIGLCLTVTLLACLTLSPALLRAFGPAVFWPFGNRRRAESNEDGNAARQERRGRLSERDSVFWSRLASTIVTYPGRVLVFSTLAMLPFAAYGTNVAVTYDFLSELAPTRPSRQGAAEMRRYFPVGETGPVVLLAQVPGGDLDSKDGKRALAQLTKDLYVEGVDSVRSLAEPRGDPPSGFSLKKAALQSHELTRALYLSKLPQLHGDVARFELLLESDPFSHEAMETLNTVERTLREQTGHEESYWQDARFVFAGTTAALRDLRTVTRSDNVRIQVLVVLAVLGVLLCILRRPLICVYLILSVLFSYYVTMGLTELIFGWIYGDTFHGLDWKVPLFLFVILVAVGQDYNIYLATRVFEEQATHGLFGGLRRAIIKTGGIITSCGVIMAGTFISMATGTLRGVVELGVALSLGVLLDTFVVRTVLVPAFLALLFRRHANRTMQRSSLPQNSHLPASSRNGVRADQSQP